MMRNQRRLSKILSATPSSSCLTLMPQSHRQAPERRGRRRASCCSRRPCAAALCNSIPPQSFECSPFIAHDEQITSSHYFWGCQWLIFSGKASREGCGVTTACRGGGPRGPAHPAAGARRQPSTQRAQLCHCSRPRAQTNRREQGLYPPPMSVSRRHRAWCFPLARRCQGAGAGGGWSVHSGASDACWLRRLISDIKAIRIRDTYEQELKAQSSISACRGRRIQGFGSTPKSMNMLLYIEW